MGEEQNPDSDPYAPKSWARLWAERERDSWIVPKTHRKRIGQAIHPKELLPLMFPDSNDFGVAYERMSVSSGSIGAGYKVFSRDAKSEPCKVPITCHGNDLEFVVGPVPFVNVAYECNSCDSLVIGPPRIQVVESNGTWEAWEGTLLSCRSCDELLFRWVHCNVPQSIVGLPTDGMDEYKHLLSSNPARLVRICQEMYGQAMRE